MCCSVYIASDLASHVWLPRDLTQCYCSAASSGRIQNSSSIGVVIIRIGHVGSVIVVFERREGEPLNLKSLWSAALGEKRDAPLRMTALEQVLHGFNVFTLGYFVVLQLTFTVLAVRKYRQAT